MRKGHLARAGVGVLLAGLGLLAASCGLAIRDLNVIDTPTEVQLGTDFSTELEQSEGFKLVSQPEVTAYVDSLGQVLARVSPRTDVAYHFKVVDSDEVNAFALPGGFVYVNRALLAKADTESEVAGVLAHEIAHVAARHGAKQLSRQYGLAFVTALALGENPDFWKQQVAQILGTGTLLHYGREAELEADDLGVRDVYAARIDPEGQASFLGKLLAMHEEEPTTLETLFSTHPPTRERVEKVQALVASLGSRAGLTRDSKRFHRVKDLAIALGPASQGSQP